MKPGDLVRIVRLPKYWGAADLRGKIGIIVGSAHVNERGVISPGSGTKLARWCTILIGDKQWTITSDCIEVVSEGG